MRVDARAASAHRGGMNLHAAPGPGLVALVGLTSPDADYARETVTVAGARLCEDPSRASLVLAAPGAPVPALVPCVRVGGGGQVSLPGDSALVVSLIAEASWRQRRDGAVWVVAGIAGGLGTTRVVRLLARSARERRWRALLARVIPRPRSSPGTTRQQSRSREPVVVDASGSVPGFARASDHSLPGVRWADLDASEDSYLPALRDHLPRIDGVSALVGDGRGGARADDPRVVAACRSLGAPLIVDAGRWDERSARLAQVIRADALVLLTHADLEGAAAMAASLSSAPPPVPALTLVASHSSARSPGLSACAPGPVLRAPTRAGRDLRALRRALATIEPANGDDPIEAPDRPRALDLPGSLALLAAPEPPGALSGGRDHA